MEKRPEYMPMDERACREVLAYGGFEGAAPDLSNEAIRNAIAAAYNKGLDDGKFVAHSEYLEAEDGSYSRIDHGPDEGASGDTAIPF